MKSLAPYAALAALLCVAPAQAQQRGSDSIRANTAGELAELCAMNTKTPEGDAKYDFCTGFAQGAIDLERRRPNQKTFCFPPSPPRRATTMADFVAWVRANSERRSMPAIDGLFRFLGEQFPCR